ncbi:MAG: recombination mediator RecR [Bacteroidota bacterium]
MIQTSDTLERLIEHFSSLPGIGRKTAQRLALHLLKVPRERITNFSKLLNELQDKIHYCSICSNITETDPCAICSNLEREKNIICVVEEPNDVIAFEKTHHFFGMYHVLGGTLSPLDGIGPEQLKIKELLRRLVDDVKEIVLALNPNVEGEATTIYLTKLLKPFNLKITRIARGIPIGGELEFTDEATLARALEDRVAL